MVFLQEWRFSAQVLVFGTCKRTAVVFAFGAHFETLLGVCLKRLQMRHAARRGCVSHLKDSTNVQLDSPCFSILHVELFFFFFFIESISYDTVQLRTCSCELFALIVQL